MTYTPKFLLDEVLQSRHAMIGENKQVAVLFADVAGFSKIAGKIDPESLHQLMEGCFTILGEEIHGTGGTINQYTGDGVMALFGAPIALEAYVARACYAALSIQHRLALYHQQATKAYGIDFRMRMGINAGQVVVGAIGDNLRLDYTAIGDTTNLAARLQASAPPGSIHVSASVAESVGHLFEFESMGARRLKGISEPQPIFSLLSDKTSSRGPSQASTDLLGREDALSQLQSAWKQANAQGPLFVSMTGLAGIGKRRLLNHFFSTLDAPDRLLLSCHCHPFGNNTVFELLLDRLADALPAKSKEKPANGSQREPIVSRVAELQAEFKRISSTKTHVDTLLDGRKKLFFEKLERLIGDVAVIHPTIVAIHNSQWIDSFSAEWILSLTEQKSAFPLLFLCTGREAEMRANGCRFDHRIDLGPLSEQSAIALFTAKLGAKRIDPLLKRLVIDRAAGNPLYILSLAETLTNGHHVVMDRNRAMLKTAYDRLNLPAGIYGILAAQLDGLAEDDKQVLLVASVIGTSFSVGLLRMVTDSGRDLTGRLERLETSGMIDRLDEGDEPAFRFRQQLMRDVAYEMMLTKTRKSIHLRVADALEKRHETDKEKVVGLLAYHYFMADHWFKALAYNIEAGHRARRIFACRTALTCFERVTKILETYHPQNHRVVQMTVLKWKGLMQYCCGHFTAALDSFQTMLALAQKSRNNQMISEGLFRVGWISFFLHKPKLALKNLTAARDRAKRIGQHQIKLKATSFLGYLHLVLGKFKTGRALLDEAMALLDETLDMETRVWTLGALIKHDYWTGEFIRAMERCSSLEKLNRHLKSRYFESFLTFHQGLLSVSLGEFKRARAFLDPCIERLEPAEETFWLPRMRNTLGWILALEKNPAAALSVNRQALSEALVGNDPETIYNARLNIAENLLQMGDIDQAEEEIQQIWREVRYLRDVYAIWRIKTRTRLALSRLFLARGKKREALRHLDGAHEIAVKTGAAKHETLVLVLRARILRQTNPKRAKQLLIRALHKAEGMKIPWLIHEIEKECSNV